MRLYGLFGLGFGEIAVVLVVLGFVLGPQTLGRLARQATERGNALKDELQNVPTEFQKGMAEGEMEARSRKARVIKVVKDDKGNGDA
jgi:Sec-independent protein translocase protein TatA